MSDTVDRAMRHMIDPFTPEFHDEIDVAPAAAANTSRLNAGRVSTDRGRCCRGRVLSFPAEVERALAALERDPMGNDRPGGVCADGCQRGALVVERGAIADGGGEPRPVYGLAAVPLDGGETR